MNTTMKRILMALLAVAFAAGCGTNGTTTSDPSIPQGINENALADSTGKTDATSWVTIKGSLACQETVSGKTTRWARFDGYTFKTKAGDVQTFKMQTSKLGRFLVYGPKNKNGKWGGLKFAAWIPWSEPHQTYTTVVKWTPSVEGEYLVAIGSYIGGVSYDLNRGCVVQAPHCVEYVSTDDNGVSLRNFYAINVASYDEGKQHLSQLNGHFIEEAINPGKCHEQSTMCPLYFMYQPVCGDIATTNDGPKTFDSVCAFKVAIRQASQFSDWNGSKGHWEMGACEKNCDPANDPYRQYDAETCKVVRFICADGYEMFSDDCGCGCRPKLKWVVSCGTPVCMIDQPNPTGVPFCKPDQQLGNPCSSEGQRCVPEKPLGCGRTYICLASEPTVCPISQRKFKTDITYLSDSEKTQLYTEVKNIKLATYRYKNAPKSRDKRLGFIIEDLSVNASKVAVNSKKERVDLYGYTSMTVAALQMQAKQLESLQRQVDELKKKIASMTPSKTASAK